MNYPITFLGRAILAFVVVLLTSRLTCAADPASTEEDQVRLQAVVAFANNVLTDAADHNRREPTPLLASGINVYTKEQLRWVLPDGRVTIVSDLAAEQNLVRVLTALTNLTGDPKYKDAAKAQFAYYFAHFQDGGGLLSWGGHRFIDLKTLTPVEFKGGVHELKNVFPDYELMYEVNPRATLGFITGFWNAHVYNWRTLEISRHGQFGHKPGPQWDHTFDDPAPYFETTGLSFLDAGNDLIYSAAMLYKLSGDSGALLWSKRLARQYVKARNPITGLGAYQYTQPRKTATTGDDNQTFSQFGDRANRQFGPDFPGHLVLEATMLTQDVTSTIYADNALMQLQLAQALGPDGREFLGWTHDGMTAFARLAYLPDQNRLRPMLTDGTDLSGFVFKRNGYYGPVGTTYQGYSASPEFMLSYARAFLLTGDPALWAVARGVARASDLGDIGSAPGADVQLNLATRNGDVFALFSVLDLYRKTGSDVYIQLARKIGDNLIQYRFHHGYFTPHEDQIWAKIDVIEPYALLALEAAIRHMPDQVPYFINSSGYIDGDYLFPDGKARELTDEVLYLPRKSIAPGTGEPDAANIGWGASH